MHSLRASTNVRADTHEQTNTLKDKSTPILLGASSAWTLLKQSHTHEEKYTRTIVHTHA
jgi:hypothetical protein